mmetsp:Transcript_15088/g.38259  ORF Transcript_15088/g.38259 Transcript_15088/m.38259 type:complete len:502 (-) Transcript_15088:134-1639(-)
MCQHVEHLQTGAYNRTLTLRMVLQLPRFGVGEILVGSTGSVHNVVGRLVDVVLSKTLLELLEEQCDIDRTGVVALGGGLAAAVLVCESGNATHIVAQLLVELVVGAVREVLLDEEHVLAKAALAQQKVAERVGTVAIQHLEGIHHVADRLAHLVTLVVEHEAVREDALEDGDVGRVQDARPDDGVEPGDVSAHYVQRSRPVVASLALLVLVGDHREVVGERVEPHVQHVIRIVGQRDAPLEVAPRDADVSHGLLETAQHLLASSLGLHELGVLAHVPHQPVLVPRHLEEVGVLVHAHQRIAAGGILVLVLFGLAVRHEGLLARVVPALVLALVDVAVRQRPLEHEAHQLLVTIAGGADKVVVAAVQPLGHLLELGRVLVADGDRLEVLLLGRLCNLQTVLIAAGAKKHITSGKTKETSNAIGSDRFVGMAHVGVSIGVVNSCRDVERLLISLSCARICHDGRSAAARETNGASMKQRDSKWYTRKGARDKTVRGRRKTCER